MKAIKSNITTISEVDYICNASNAWGCSFLDSGVSGAIARAAGFAFQWESFKLCHSLKLDAGDLYKTSAGKLQYKGILHLITMRKPGSKSTLDTVRKCLDSLIEYCIEKDIIKVALPALGTGVGGLDYKEVANIYLENLNIESIDFVIADINSKFIDYINSRL